MPRGGKNGKRGGKNRKKGKNLNVSKRELIYKEEGQEYATVSKLLGNCRMEVYCLDGKNRLAKVRGKFKKRVWMNIGDLILVDLRSDFDNDEKCDIIHKYWAEEAKALKNAGEIPDNLELREDDENENGGLNIEFGEDSEEEETKNKQKKINPEDLVDSDSDDSDEDEETKNQNFFNNQKKPDPVSDSEEEKDEWADI